MKKQLLLFIFTISLFDCNKQKKDENDNKNEVKVENDYKKGVKIGVSKYSPFGPGSNRIYDQVVSTPEKWSHLRPFFTKKKKDKDRFVRTTNSKEEIVYKVDKNIQGYCIYTTYNPGVKHDSHKDISLGLLAKKGFL